MPSLLSSSNSSPAGTPRSMPGCVPLPPYAQGEGWAPKALNNRSRSWSGPKSWKDDAPAGALTAASALLGLLTGQGLPRGPTRGASASWAQPLSLRPVASANELRPLGGKAIHPGLGAKRADMKSLTSTATSPVMTPTTASVLPSALAAPERDKLPKAGKVEGVGESDVKCDSEAASTGGGRSTSEGTKPVRGRSPSTNSDEENRGCKGSQAQVCAESPPGANAKVPSQAVAAAGCKMLSSSPSLKCADASVCV
jgi:hypothetical protein